MGGRWTRRAPLLLVAGALVYGLVTFANVWVGTGWDDREQTEAIVVLGAAQYNGRPSPVLQARLDHALELYDTEVAPLIVVTGGAQEGDRSSEALAGFEYLRNQGVPEADLMLEVDGTNTWESLAASARFLRDLNVSEVVLVSDPYHSVRVLGIAAELGLDAQVSPRSGGSSLRQMARETIAVSAGRLVGYRRLLRIEDVANAAG